MNDRLFSFGCSFTRYHWPTYADILAQGYKEFFNWGQSGAGNFFIFNSLVECHKRHEIKSTDTVCVMWSSIAREDRYVKGNWLLSGSMYSQDIYDTNFIEKFSDPTGYLLRDLSLISATKSMLDQIGCKYYFFSIVPLACFEDMFEKWFGIDKKIINLYNEEIAVIKPSVYEVVFNNNWHSRVGYRNFNDLKENYEYCRGADWPSSWVEFFDLYNNNKLGKLENEILDKFEFRNKLIRTDYHPVPAEHLEYLQNVVPEINISDRTIAWINNINEKVLKQEYFSWNKGNLIKRF
jgi:hypothetical protein